MPSLRDLQQDVAGFILGGGPGALTEAIVADGIDPDARLGIYRNTAREVMTASLRIAFPCVERLVGSAFFDMAASRFCRAQPPVSACLNDYGTGFAAFLAAMPETAGLPYLPDVARFEFALNHAATAIDAPVLAIQALAEIPAENHPELRFQAHPSVSVLQLRYPADHIADAVLSGDPDAMASVSLTDEPMALIVWRNAGGVQAERLSATDNSFLQEIVMGETLGGALGRAGDDAAAVLARHFVAGCVSGFRVGAP